MTRYIEDLNECTDPTSGDYLWIVDASASASDKDRKVNANKLAIVTTGSWTPGVSFGGGTTGITYTTQVGRWKRHGDMIFVYGYLLLSSKGSSTGSALITGMPTASANISNLYQTPSLLAHGLQSITGNLQGYIAPNATTINLEYLGTGTHVTLTDGHFTNTTELIVSAVYAVA